MKNKNYPWEIIPRKIENSDVKLVGVRHTSDFFKEHKKFYEEKIKKSPEGIMLEQPIGCEFWEDGNGDDPFFSELGEIAYKNNIPIYQADPINKIFLADAIPLTTIFGIGLITLNLPNQNEITRRDFLRKGALISLGTSISYGSLWPYVLLNKEKQHNKLNVLAYGQINWRNVKIAEGIERLVEKDKPQKLTAFQGASHTSPIAFYLDHPILRKMKNISYSPLNLLGKKGVRKYLPDNSPIDLRKYNQSWELAETF